jgi:hypothetical protein
MRFFDPNFFRQTTPPCLLIVRDLVGRVCNVVLIKCPLDLGKPKRGWNFGRRVQGPGEEQGELVYEQPGTEVDDSCHSKEGSK